MTEGAQWKTVNDETSVGSGRGAETEGGVDRECHLNHTPGSWWASLIGQSPLVDSQCPGCLRQAVVTIRLPCMIVESPRRHRHVPFVNIASLCSWSIKRRQWKHKLDYYGVDFAHLATGCGIKPKDPSGLDSDRWILHSRCCENPAWAKALVGFLCHLSAGFTDLGGVGPWRSSHQTSYLAWT